METWQGKTLFITGASRGIGQAIAHKFARLGANIVIAAKSATSNGHLPGTVFTVAKEVEDLGGQALPIVLDVRDDEAVQQAMQAAAKQFSSIDVLINNASAIKMQNVEAISMKNFDLIWSVNTRASMVCAKAALPYLRKSTNPHILTFSPPINCHPKWFGEHMPYTLSKYGMSMLTLGLAEELSADKIAVNSLWPQTTIATSAIEFNFDPKIYQASRLPSIMADASLIILSQKNAELTGQFLIDEAVLRGNGQTDFSQYQHTAGQQLFTDLFLD